MKEAMKLVPVEPTQKMLDAPPNAYPADALVTWKAMLAAAPQPAQIESLADIGAAYEDIYADQKAELAKALAEQPAQHPKTKQISECLAVLRPTVKGKFPHEQALEELVGYIAAPQPAQRKPLTDEEIIKCWGQVSGTRYGYVVFARAIEAAHNIKEQP